MVEIIKDFQEVCVDKITVESGPQLELTANITSPAQFDLLMLGGIYGPHGLRSAYFEDQRDRALRLTCGIGGRGRSDIVEIGKSVKMGTFGNGMPRWGL